MLCLQKRAGGVAQGVDPEFKAHYHKKKKKKKNVSSTTAGNLVLPTDVSEALRTVANRQNSFNKYCR
jgi:hypothetical protein